LTVTKTSSAPFYGSIDLPATEGSYSNVLYVSVYEDGQWAALSQATKDKRVIIADAYLSSGFDEILTLTMRAESAMSIIGPDFIRTDNLAAISANLGSVTAGSIVVGSSNKLWLNDDTTAPTVALAIGGSTKASAPFLVYETGAFHAGGASANYVDWNGSTLIVKADIRADAGYLGSLTVNGNLTMNGGKIQWNSTNSYIDNTKVHVSDSATGSIVRIGDSAVAGLLDLDMFTAASGEWVFGIHVTDGGNSAPVPSALYYGLVPNTVAGNGVDSVFRAIVGANGEPISSSSNSNVTDGLYVEIFGGSLGATPTNGSGIVVHHHGPGTAAYFNRTATGADGGPTVFAGHGRAGHEIYWADIGAAAQTAFYVDGNGRTDHVALNAGHGALTYIKYAVFQEHSGTNSDLISSGAVPNPPAGYFVVYARQCAMHYRNSGGTEYTF